MLRYYTIIIFFFSFSLICWIVGFLSSYIIVYVLCLFVSVLYVLDRKTYKKWENFFLFRLSHIRPKKKSEKPKKRLYNPS